MSSMRGTEIAGLVLGKKKTDFSLEFLHHDGKFPAILLNHEQTFINLNCDCKIERKPVTCVQIVK